MIEAIITLLIYVCVLALVVYLVLWVLGQVGIAIPVQVVKIVWVIVALVALLLIVRMMMGSGVAWPAL